MADGASLTAVGTTSTAVIIDTDCGVDDAVALCWAITEPRIDVVGITSVWGNTGVVGAAANVGRVLAALGRSDIPVALGARGPIAEAPDLRVADFIHGTDGLGNTFRPESDVAPVDESAVDLLRRLVDERPGEVTVVSIGPLSNIAGAVLSDPGWASRVKELVVMGGAVAIQGNALPVGEANIAHDPVAADVIGRANWVIPPLMVNLDVTLQATLSDNEFDLLGEHRSTAAEFLDEPLRFYRTFGSTFTPGECPSHDLLAVMTVVERDLVVSQELPVAIQATPGPAWGQTVVDRRVPFFAAASAANDGEDAEQPPHDDGFRPWRVAQDVDVERFRLLVRRLFGEAEQGAAQ